MFKKFLNLIKNNKEEKLEEIENEEKKLDVEYELKSECISQEVVQEKEFEEEVVVVENEEKTEKIISVDDKFTLNNQSSVDIKIVEKEDINNKNNKLIENYELTSEDLIYIKKSKIKRGKLIKAIDLYSNEEIIFNTHMECSKKIKVPLEYIKENLEYGYTDYFGEAINYLGKKLRIDISTLKDEGISIVEIFNHLHNQLWSENISEKRRDDILSSEKIDPVRMHYKFEMMDNEYDEYFKKYGKIIRRGGKKKIELIDKKNEVIEVFKSLDDCAKYFNKDKGEIIDRLKYGECKIGRYEIRYSLTR